MKYLIPQRQFKRKKSSDSVFRMREILMSILRRGSSQGQKTIYRIAKNEREHFQIMARVCPVRDALRSLGPPVELIKGRVHLKCAIFSNMKP